MEQNLKELLLKDICARLPYGVMCNIGLEYPLPLQRIFVDRLDGILLDFYEDVNDYQVYLSEVKPYLRPLSSMTEKEKKELLQISNFDPDVDDICYDSIRPIERSLVDIVDIANFINWLNAHHFDYRGLIPMGLAIEVTKENNPYKE